MKSARPTGLISRKSGTIVVYALIVLAVGAVVLAGWVQLLATRSANVEIKASEVQRRITLENSRLLASQYLLQNVFSGTLSGPVTNSNSWGRFVIPASATSALDSAALAAPGGSSNTINHFSPGSYGGYTLDLTVSLSDGLTNFRALFRARSRSPMLGYDLFTQQDPSNSMFVSGNVAVANNVMIWNPLLGPYSFVGNTTNTYQAGATNATGPTPLGFALAPMTSWSANFSGSSNTLGQTNYNSVVVRSGTGHRINPTDAVSGTPTGVTVTTNATNRAVTINLGTVTNSKFSLGPGTANFSLRVTGYSGTEPKTSVVIIATNATNITDISFSGGANNRHLYLGMRNRTAGMTLTGAGSWRLGGVFEATPLTISGLTITGGLRTDRNLTVSGGTLTILRETDPGTLESATDRVGWLEVYRQ